MAGASWRVYKFLGQSARMHSFSDIIHMDDEKHPVVMHLRDSSLSCPCHKSSHDNQRSGTSSVVTLARVKRHITGREQ